MQSSQQATEYLGEKYDKVSGYSEEIEMEIGERIDKRSAVMVYNRI